MNITYEQIEEMENTSNLYIVFEEDNSKKAKCYDLTIAVFDNLEEALKFREEEQLRRTEKVYTAKYDDYMAGFYNYIWRKEPMEIKRFSSNWEIYIDDMIVNMDTTQDDINNDLYDDINDVVNTIIDDVETKIKRKLKEKEIKDIETMAIIDFSSRF